MTFRALTNAAAAGLLLIAPASARAETINIAIGHQSMTTATYPPGVIAEHLNLIQKYLPHSGKYENVTYNLAWKDYASGPPITNMMLADKLEFGSMGDYPIVTNGAMFQQTRDERSIFFAVTGYNYRGSGEGIVVPLHSPIQSIQDLKGKSMSVPVGSDSWGMLLKALQDNHLTGTIEIANQSPAVGAANIAANKILAHADFDPWPELMEFRGTARKIYDGSETGIPFLDGIVVRKEFADEYPEVVVAMCKAIIAADKWVQENPVEASIDLEKWTGIPREVQYLYLSKGGILTLDPTIKKPLVDALKYDHGIVAKLKGVPPLDFSKWIDDRYIREAYKELGMDYDKAVATINDPKITNMSLPPEIWVTAQGVRDYPSVGAMLNAVAALKKTGTKINATYVYDSVIGVKLFGDTAYYGTGANGIVKAFMLKPDAQAFAEQGGGKVVTFAEAISNPHFAAVDDSHQSAAKN